MSSMKTIIIPFNIFLQTVKPPPVPVILTPMTLQLTSSLRITNPGRNVLNAHRKQKTLKIRLRTRILMLLVGVEL